MDEEYSDWNTVTWNQDDAGDNTSLDIEKLSAFHDAEFIYFKIEFNREILLQEDNDITLYLSGDNFGMNYNFGRRRGWLVVGGGETEVFHENIGLRMSPSVSSNIFEIKISRRFENNGVRTDIDDTFQVSVTNEISNGDKIPNNGTIAYTIEERLETPVADYRISKSADTDFRVCSYNVLRDRIFEADTRPQYSAILNLIDADIYLFQEVYDYSANELLSRMANSLNALDNSFDWYAAKEGADLIVISKYPIIESFEIAGNGIFIIELDGQEVMVCNLHLPCCDNDQGREREIDRLLEFIRDSKDGKTNYELKENTPFLIAGDMNFVGNSDQVTALLNGQLFSNSMGPDFEIDWDDNGLTDMKPFASGSNEVHTWSSNFSEFCPGRLDYVFYSDHTLINRNSFVLNAEYLSQEELDTYELDSWNTRFASDHLPIIGDFSFRTSVSNKEIHSLNFNLFPNPSTGFVYVESKNVSELILINMQGQQLMQLAAGMNDISQLDPGIYFILSPDSTVTTKLILH